MALTNYQAMTAQELANELTKLFDKYGLEKSKKILAELDELAQGMTEAQQLEIYKEFMSEIISNLA